MKNLTYLLVIVLIPAWISAQNAPELQTNQKLVVKKLKLDEDDRYVLEEVAYIRDESKIWLNEAQKMFNDVQQIKKIIKASQDFEDLRIRAEKKAKKYQVEMLYRQFDALEYLEMANDMLYNLYSHLLLSIDTKADMESIQKANQIVFEADATYKNAKKKREKVYEMGLKKDAVWIMFEAQKMEELAIQKQEKALSLLLKFEYVEQDLWANSIGDVIQLKVIEVKEENNQLAENSNSTDEINIEDLLDVDVDAILFEEESLVIEETEKTYKVQVGAFLGNVDAKEFKGLSPLTVEKSESGFTKYLVGDYASVEVAQHALKIMKESGFMDAFVVVYENGERKGLFQLQEIQTPLAEK